MPNTYVLINIMKHLTLDDIKIPKPDFKTQKIPKGQAISSWLIEWIKYSLEHGIADIGDFIPAKEELALFLGVSSATIQNSIRYVKNLGWLISKQSSGTTIADYYYKDLKQDDGLFHGSIIETKIKKIVIDKMIKFNCPIPSVKELSELTQVSSNTIRMALLNLEVRGYLEKIHLRGNKYSWLYKKEFEFTKEELKQESTNDNCTLTNQLVEKIQNYLEKTYKYGDRILSNQAFSNMFEVSIKTINDTMKILASRGFIMPRRGRYGTIYLGNSDKSQKNSFMDSERKKLSPQNPKKFAYSWQKTLQHLKKHIAQNYEIGDKISTIRKLASILNVSPNTVRRALSDLVQNGYLITKCGKSGGIFIIDMPELEGDSYKWLALNPDILADN